MELYTRPSMRCTGWRILAHSWAAQGGEIDIVAKRGRTIVFVEVKARADLDAAALVVHPRPCHGLCRPDCTCPPPVCGKKIP